MASGLAKRGSVDVPMTAMTRPLLAGLGSNSAAPALTIVALVPCPARRTREAVLTAPAARFPKSQVTIPPALAQAPWLAAAVTKAERSESWLVSLTPDAAEGPRFVTLTVSVTLLPTGTRFVLRRAPTARSTVGKRST